MAKIWKCGGELRLSMLWFFIVRSHPVIIKILKIDQYTPGQQFELPFVAYFRENQRAIENKNDKPIIKEYVAMPELLLFCRLITSGYRKTAWNVLVGVNTKHQRKKLIQFYLAAIAPTALLKLYLKISKPKKWINK